MCGVETKSLNRLCKIAIDTQFEKGMQMARPFVRDSPFLIKMKRDL